MLKNYYTKVYLTVHKGMTLFTESCSFSLPTIEQTCSKNNFTTKTLVQLSLQKEEYFYYTLIKESRNNKKQNKNKKPIALPNNQESLNEIHQVEIKLNPFKSTSIALRGTNLNNLVKKDN